VVAVSFGAQLWSLHLLDERKEFSRRLNAAVAARPEPVLVTDDRWAGAELYSQYSGRPMFYSRSPDAWRVLQKRLQAAGHREVLLVRRGGLGRSPGATVIDDGGLDYFVTTLQAGRF
jgi:hypothetical protein